MIATSVVDIPGMSSAARSVTTMGFEFVSFFYPSSNGVRLFIFRRILVVSDIAPLTMFIIPEILSPTPGDRFFDFTLFFFRFATERFTFFPLRSLAIVSSTSNRAADSTSER